MSHCSQSNYAQTQLSLASSLNLNYLENLSDQYTPGKTSRTGIPDLIYHSTVRQALENLGYTILAFETGFKVMQWEDADVYLSPEKGALRRAQILRGINEFEVMLLRTTASLFIMNASSALHKFVKSAIDNPCRINRDLILYDLEQLRQMPDRPSYPAN